MANTQIWVTTCICYSFKCKCCSLRVARPGCKPTLHPCFFSRWLSSCSRWGKFFICTFHFLTSKTKSILKGQDLIKITFTASTSESTFKTKQNKTAGAFMAVNKMTVLKPVPWFRLRCQECYPSLLFFGLFLVLLSSLLQYWLFYVLVFWLIDFKYSYALGGPEIPVYAESFYKSCGKFCGCVTLASGNFSSKWSPLTAPTTKTTTILWGG